MIDPWMRNTQPGDTDPYEYLLGNVLFQSRSKLIIEMALQTHHAVAPQHRGCLFPKH